jgi:aminoglycoside/choline kinase family phosphotransferase
MKEIKSLEDLFISWANEKPYSIELLPESGSNRKYYIIKSQNYLCIGVENADIRENTAFFELSKHFLSINLNVPEVLAVNHEKKLYLLNDLGDETLYSFILKHKNSKSGKERIFKMYKKVIDELPKFQIKSVNGLDFSKCYPREKFDRQSISWDLNYFKYYFLKLSQIQFDEQKLEEDFTKLTDYLLTADNDYFMYRDFQSRNIMLHKNKLYFIDFQGGRKGPLQYDIASLLWDAKADLDMESRKILYDYYLEKLSDYIKFDKNKFTEYYYGFSLIRILQAMGAYGFRGFYENKTIFLQSIPYALKNLDWILNNTVLPIKINYLKSILQQIPLSNKVHKIINTQKLNVEINSFSYKKNLPKDKSGNGGGFVFDCRALPNPGRIEQLKHFTGLDKEIISYFENEIVVKQFIDYVFSIVKISIDNYIERGFTNLMINFGCTGGQHRSVYCAERIASLINKYYSIGCDVNHLELK